MELRSFTDRAAFVLTCSVGCMCPHRHARQHAWAGLSLHLTNLVHGSATLCLDHLDYQFRGSFIILNPTYDISCDWQALSYLCLVHMEPGAVDLA